MITEALNQESMVVVAAAVMAILMAGSRRLKTNLLFYAMQTLLIAFATISIHHENLSIHVYLLALAIASIKAIGIPIFLAWIMEHINVQNDTGNILPAPLAMHLSCVLLGVSALLTAGLPVIHSSNAGALGATAALSLLFSGMLLMLTRKVAISQIVGFLTMENGIYLFALTETKGMPLIIEMGILLDVLVGVMIAGLLLFRIKKSFEHIDVTQLTGLRD